MPKFDPNRISAGFFSLEGGMDSGRTPNIIGDNQTAFAVNVTFRGGFPKTRPPFRYHALTFKNEEEETFFKTSHVQAFEYYNPFSGLPALLVMIAGRLFRINVSTDYSVQWIYPTTSKQTETTSNFVVPPVGGTVTVEVGSTSFMDLDYPNITIGGANYILTAVIDEDTITVENVDDTPAATVNSGAVVEFNAKDLNSSRIDQAFMIQAEEYMIIQDGQSKPLFYNGSSIRRSERGELPVGTVMAYGLGRVWIAKGRNFVAGDVVNGDTSLGTANILKFTENDYFNEGGAFAVPLQSGNITAMKFTSVLDSSLGQGELLVMTEKGVFSVNIPPDRDTWKNLSYPVQRVSGINFGATSQGSTVLVNSDIFFRSKDGIRSFIMARRDFSVRWGNTPVSKEMGRVLNLDTKTALNFCSAVNFDNRYLMTVNPVKLAFGAYHRGLVAMDFDLVSSMGAKAPPAYDGLWTGIKPTALTTGDFQGIDRCFSMVYNTSGQNELWEIMPKGDFDHDSEGDRRIECFLETKSYIYGDPTEYKRLETADLFVDNLVGQVDFNVKYRPDQYPAWVDWKSWSECADYQQCNASLTTCITLKNLQPQYRTLMSLPQPEDACETTTNKPFRLGYEFQARIQWTGQVRLTRFVMHCKERQNEPYSGCLTQGECKSLDICPDSPYSY